MFLSEVRKSSNVSTGVVTESQVFEIFQEAEERWSNICLETAKKEHVAYIRKSVTLMEGAVSDFFKSAKEWFIKMWTKFKAWFMKIVDTVVFFFKNGDKFMSQYSDDLRKVTDKDLKGLGKVDICEYVENGSSTFERICPAAEFAAIDNRINGLRGTTEDAISESEEQIAEAMDDVYDTFKDNITEARKKTSLPIETKMVRGAVAFFKGKDKAISALEKAKSQLERMIRNAVKAAERVEKQANKDEARITAALHRAIINLYKKASSLAGKQISESISVIKEVAGQYVNVCKKALVAYRKRERLGEYAAD